MNIGKNLYNTDIHELHSEDAYYRNVVLDNNKLIIPYINIGVSNHPLNEVAHMKYINFCYIMFVNVTYLSVYLCNQRLIVLNKGKKTNMHYFGGTYLDRDCSIFNDMTICSESSYLQTIDLTEMTAGPRFMWSMDYLSGIKSVSEKTVNDFFNHEFLV